MSAQPHFGAMTRRAEPAFSGAALTHSKLRRAILGGLLLLSAP